MVLAIVLGDMQDALSHPILKIRKAITHGKIGETNVVKDFLMPGNKTTTITRNKTNRRRKCDVIVLSKVESDLRQQLLAG